ncbi:MAG: hypothetical protein C0398_07475 [Coprothermobacter sp.]|nr:hypothetical protein [Coprothermobacter sp.]
MGGAGRRLLGQALIVGPKRTSYEAGSINCLALSCLKEAATMNDVAKPVHVQEPFIVNLPSHTSCDSLQTLLEDSGTSGRREQRSVDSLSVWPRIVVEDSPVACAHCGLGVA